MFSLTMRPAGAYWPRMIRSASFCASNDTGISGLAVSSDTYRG